MIRRAKNRGRLDDDISLVLKKKKINDRDRLPVLEYFKSKNILDEIDGERDIATIQEEIINKLNK